jgi:hypothetical protein
MRVVVACAAIRGFAVFSGAGHVFVGSVNDSLVGGWIQGIRWRGQRWGTGKCSL